MKRSYVLAMTGWAMTWIGGFLLGLALGCHLGRVSPQPEAPAFRPSQLSEIPEPARHPTPGEMGLVEPFHKETK
jgi:hypothetical protein